MSRGKLLLGGGILLFLFQYTATAQTATDSGTVYTLQQCVDSALKNNPTVQTAEFTVESARLTARQQQATMLPSVSGFGQYGSNSGKSINNYTNTYVNQKYGSGYGQVSGSWVLFNGLSIQNFVRQYALLYEANKKDWQQARDLMTVNVILAYLNVLSTQEQLGMAKTQADASRSRVDLLTKQNEEGAIAPSDLTDMKGQLASDELTVMTTFNALEAYKLALAQYMNIPYSPTMKIAALTEDLTPAPYNATVDQIYQAALQNLAQVQAARLHTASTQKAVKGTRGTMFPTISLVGQVNTNYSTVPAQVLQNTTIEQTQSFVTVGGTQYPVYAPQDHSKLEKISFGNQFNNNLFTFVGVNLNIPIFNALKLRTNYKLAQVNRDQAVFNEKTTLVQLRQSVESYYVTMMSDYRIYNTLQDQVTNYEASYKAAGIKYDAGAMKSVDFIIYKTNIDRARLNFIQSKYNYILQTKILDYFQGKLTW
ncbi:MAG TPA: TolC family protein [Puia sp.]|nr:TolC family protein [Puia sp.]